MTNGMSNREKGLAFEKQCFSKLEDLGFTDLSLTKNTDNGADIIGCLNGTRYIFQCKNCQDSQGNKCVQEVIGAKGLYKGNRCVVISYSSFTSAAIALAKANNCILIRSSDFFDLSEFPPRGYTDIFDHNILVYDFEYQIIERYEEIKKAKGRTPKWDELSANIRYLIRKKYKNYGNFLTTIGESKHSNKHTDEELRKEYVRIRTLLGRVPTAADIRTNTTFPYNQFHAYPLTKLQRECGDRPKIERGVDKESLKRAYFDLEKKLGHPPSINEIDEKGEYRSSYYSKRWGNFDGFLHDIGRTRTEAGLPRVYTKDEIVSLYALVKILLSVVKECDDYKVNKTTLEQLRLNDRCLISPSTYSNPSKFGSWKAFMDYLDESSANIQIEKITKLVRTVGFEALLSKLDGEND